MSDTSPERAPEAHPGPAAAGPSEDTAPAVEAPAASVVRGGAAASEPESGGADALIGTLLAGRYRIEKLLGTGGMGAVYRAEHVHMRKAVAVKVLHREMTYLPEVVARFEREAVAAARIEHAHVAAATDFGQLDDGAFYLVLEFVEGRSLRDLLKEHGRLSPELTLHITRQTADALSAAHASDVVHRDLKPDNIMLIERDGDSFYVKVLDFGIAKLNTGDASQQLTQLGSVFGTPEYMSPEQATGTPVDSRADLYTLGILAYEMLAGHTPFDDEDLVVVLTRQMTMDPPPLPADVPPAVSELVFRLLAKDPDARVQTAEELVVLIDALLGPAAGGLTPSPVSSLSPLSRVGSPSPPSADENVGFNDTVLSMQRPPMPAASLPGSSVGRTRGISALFGPIVRKLPVLTRSVDVGGQSVPVWGIAATGAVVAVLGLFLLVGVVLASHGGSTQTTVAAGGGVTEVEPDLAQLMSRAETGDRQALSQLQARPASERTAAEWRAIGRGLSAIGQAKSGLAAYDKALGLDPSLSKDRAIARDVHAAALVPATAESALDVAVAGLGATGADIVYDVWSETRGKKGNSQINKLAKKRLDSDALRAKASPALLVALDLSKARGCASFKPILQRAATDADERSRSKLKALTARSGCGFLGLSDCYSCLRRSSDLSDAIKHAESTPAPTFP